MSNIAKNRMVYLTKNGMVVTPYRNHQARDLEKDNSIFDQVYHKWNEVSGFQVDNYHNQTAYITKRIPLDYIKRFFPGYQVADVRRNFSMQMEYPVSLNQEIQLRPAQTEIANEVVSSMKKTSEWFINLQTGAGKTLTSIYLSTIFHYKTLVVCFDTEILKQWNKTYLEKTNIQEERICFIKSSESLYKMLRENHHPEDKDVYLVTDSLLTSFLNRYDYQDLQAILNKLGIGLLIYDEAHRNMSLMIKLNACFNPRYTLYLSADFGQGDYKKERKYLELFKNAKILTPRDETSRSMKYTKVVISEYNTRPSVNDELSIKNRYGYSAEYYMDYQIKKGKIQEVLKSILDNILKSIREMNPGYKTLILVNNISHADYFYTYLQEEYKNTDFRIGRFHSQMDSEEKDLTKQQANVIVSTYKSFGVGKDLEDIKYVIGMNQSNKIEDNQAAGRSRPVSDGTPSFYFIITDTGFRYCREKLKRRLPYLVEKKSNDNIYRISY